MKQNNFLIIFAIFLSTFSCLKAVAEYKNSEDEKKFEGYTDEAGENSLRKFLRKANKKEEEEMETKTIEDGDILVFLRDSSGIKDITVKKGKPSYYFENSIVLNEVQKIPTWEEQKLNEDFGLPIPDSSFRKFSKASVSSFFEYTSIDKRSRMSAFLSGSSVKDGEISYTDVEEIGVMYKRRFVRDKRGQIKMFGAIGYSNIKNYNNQNAENKPDFSNIETATALISTELKPDMETEKLQNIFMKVDIGAKSSEKQEIGFINFYFEIPLNDKVFFTFETEASNIVGGSKITKKKVLFFRIADFERYGSYFSKIGLTFEAQKDEFFALVLMREKSTRYAYKQDSLYLKYIIKF